MAELTPPFQRCNGIQRHTDTVWQRCPKATQCQRYIQRHDPTRGPVVSRMCSTVEFEHWVKTDG